MGNKKVIQKIVLGGVVVENGKILILQRHKDEDTFPNIWELPSGEKEPLESWKECLIREVKEETGIDVGIIMPVSVFNYRIEELKEIHDCIQINFLVKPKRNFKLKLSKEHQAFTWIGESKIDRYDLTEPIKNAIQKAFELLPKLNIKT